MRRQMHAISELCRFRFRCGADQPRTALLALCRSLLPTKHPLPRLEYVHISLYGSVGGAQELIRSVDSA